MNKRTFILVHPEARRRAHQAIDEANDGFRVIVCEPLKSRDQEEKYHAMIGDIAKQWEFCGRKWNSEDVKRLCLDQFRRDTINDPDLSDEWSKMRLVDMAPSIDKTGVVALGVQSRKLTKKLASAFVEWLYAFGAEIEVSWSV